MRVVVVAGKSFFRPAARGEGFQTSCRQVPFLIAVLG
jgi:hypothetical protein